MLKTRVITALLILPVLLLALFGFPRWTWSLFTGLIVAAGVWEWSRMCGFSPRQLHIYWGVSAVLLVALLGAHWTLAQSAIVNASLVLFILGTIFWIVLVPLWLGKAWRPANAWLTGVAGWLVLVPAWAALVLLRELGPFLLLTLLVIVWIADIGAYFAGKRFGKNKLAPAISPGKTWEGVLGGMIGVMLFFLVWFFAVKDLNAYWTRGLFWAGVWLPVLFLALAGISVLGDLFESWMKRGADMKDSSNLLPGHGGILDRVDALTSMLPLAGMLIFGVPRLL